MEYIMYHYNINASRPDRYVFLGTWKTKLLFYCYLIFIACTAILLVNNQSKLVHRGEVPCNGTTLRYNLEEPSNAIWWNMVRGFCFIAAMATTVVLLIAVECTNYVNTYKFYARVASDDTDSLYSVRILRFIMFFILGAISVFLICLILQITIACPKPYFLTATKSVCCTTSNATSCPPQNDQLDILYLSTPSHHVALTSFQFLFVSTYLVVNVGCKPLRLVLTTLQGIYSFYVLFDRVHNHQNHPHDIIIGFGIGMTIGIVMVSKILHSFRKPPGLEAMGYPDPHEDCNIPDNPPVYEHPPSYDSAVGDEPTCEVPPVCTAEEEPPPTYESVFGEACIPTAVVGPTVQIDINENTVKFINEQGDLTEISVASEAEKVN